ncbi:MAG: aminotransferase class IV [Candidatus Neomarinimicrobiota bacterium]
MIRTLINAEWKLLKNESLDMGSAAFDFQRGLYETFRTLNHRALFLEAHINRLTSGAEKIGLFINYSDREIRSLAEMVIRDSPQADQRVRLLAVPHNLILYSEALDLKLSIYRGVKTITVNSLRLIPELKTTDYSACLKAWLQARGTGAYEALLNDDNGHIYEGSRSNVFWVRNKKLFTREADVLPGITRQIVISKFPRRTNYGILNKKDLNRIDEMFITNSGSGIVPVIKVNEQVVGFGSVGSITRQLLKLYKGLIEAESRVVNTDIFKDKEVF